MGFIEEFRLAIDNYEGDYVRFGAGAYQLYGAGQILNEHEWFRFQLQIYNKGHLDMKNVVVQIEGTSYATVSPTYGGAMSAMNISFGDIRAHGSAQTSAWTYGRATKDTNGQDVDIVKAKVSRWDADLDHLLTDHSSFANPMGLVHQTIEPKVVH